MHAAQLTLPEIEESSEPRVSFVYSPRHRRMLTVTLNKTTRCDARCTHAKGFDCECSCGGKNHGLMSL